MASWIWRRNWGGSTPPLNTSASAERSRDENDRAGDGSDAEILPRDDTHTARSKFQADIEDEAMRAVIRVAGNRPADLVAKQELEGKITEATVACIVI
mmetsp:Transcript_26417/g.52642  ORF Transcript_26417/g.52642 Transcript_26417/m.52642 type:complete len:98 (-) Transcript_26417:141-434(-)